jgi:acyl-coenzyme A synthetase/AMP-(fatty) acid ligase
VAIAFVSPVPGAEVNADKLRTTCREILSFKTPKRFIIESALPKNANGKVDKKALRARLEV